MTDTAAVTEPVNATLPSDGYSRTLIGRIWDAAAGGPSPVAITEAASLTCPHALPR